MRQPAKTQYRSAAGLVGLLTLLLACGVILDLAAAGADSMQIDLIRRAMAGEEITEKMADANDARQGLIGIAQLALFILTTIFFCIWIHRANRNARAFGTDDCRWFRPAMTAHAMININIVEADGRVFETYFTLAGLADFDIFVLKNFGATVFVNSNCFGHERFPIKFVLNENPPLSGEQ